jgi:hypothetical protein
MVRKRGVWDAKKAQAIRSAISGPIVGLNRNWRIRMSGEVGSAVSIKFFLRKKDGTSK